MGHRAEAPVSLEQVAAQAKDKIRYTYDFGDDWVHEIVVEKVVDRDPAPAYPCCTGGRRAAPPDDCGGIWGYGELVEILADRRQPEHEERLEWLGMDSASQFDPAAFDVDEVNRWPTRLTAQPAAGLRRSPVAGRARAGYCHQVVMVRRSAASSRSGLMFVW